MYLLILTSEAYSMVNLNPNNTLKRLRNRYRLVIMNEDTYEEVAKFKLSRFSVYITLSSIFVLLTGLIVALIVFTPLKYYLPNSGYGNVRQIREFRQLKFRTDSLEQALQYQQRYFNDLQKVLTGKVPALDTNRLDIEKSDTLNK